MNHSDQRLNFIAKRVAWWKSPEETLADSSDFLCRVMTLGDWNDVTYVLGIFGENNFKTALQTAKPGIFDPASWHYWHWRLGLILNPELPRRVLR